jgi:hypothetical protein
MPFLVGCFGLLFPRIVLFFVWLFGHGYLDRAYPSWIWPVLGFIFFPLTTLVFAYANNALANGGAMPALGWVLIAIAGLVDLGCLRGGRHATEYRKSRRNRDD